MRALLLFNPNATTTTPQVRDAIASALSRELELEVHATKQRGHATHLVAGAVHDGIEAVLALGGDGTANETIQAVAGTGVPTAILPGGSTNVFARAVGLPNDPVAATAIVLDRLRTGQHRTINLGAVNGRYFAVNAGFGFDAAIVRAVERSPGLRRAINQLTFVYCGLREWFVDRDPASADVTLRLPGREPRSGYGVTIIGNGDPYTYLGGLTMRATPLADFEAGLDLLALPDPSTPAILRILAATFRDGRHLGTPGVDYHHDLDAFTLTSTSPLPLMVDGDYAGETTEASFRSVPGGLRLLA